MSPAKSASQAKFLAMLIDKKKGLTKAQKEAEKEKLFRGTSKKDEKVKPKPKTKKKGKGK